MDTIGLSITFIALLVFRATNGANANSQPEPGFSCFADAACFLTGAASSLGDSEAFCASVARSTLRGLTARAFCSSSSSYNLAASILALTGFSGCR